MWYLSHISDNFIGYLSHISDKFIGNVLTYLSDHGDHSAPSIQNSSLGVYNTSSCHASDLNRGVCVCSPVPVVASALTVAIYSKKSHLSVNDVNLYFKGIHFEG